MFCRFVTADELLCGSRVKLGRNGASQNAIIRIKLGCQIAQNQLWNLARPPCQPPAGSAFRSVSFIGYHNHSQRHLIDQEAGGERE